MPVGSQYPTDGSKTGCVHPSGDVASTRVLSRDARHPSRPQEHHVQPPPSSCPRPLRRPPHLAGRHRRARRLDLPVPPAAPAWSAPTAPASRRCCASPPASSPPRPGSSASPARSATCPRTSPSTGQPGRRPARHRRGDPGAPRGRRRHRRRRPTSRRSATTGTSRSGSSPSSPGSGCRPTCSTAAWASCPAVRWSGSAWPGCCCGRPDVLLLDEPTNNLDASGARPAARRGRRRGRAACWWSATTAELLERMDRIGELRDGAVRWYGGGYSAYVEQVAAEQAAAEQAVVAARSDVRRQRADRVEAERVGRAAPPPGPAQRAAGPTWPRRAGLLKNGCGEARRGLPQGPRRAARVGARERLDQAESRLREDRDDPGRPARHRGAPRPASC